MLPTMVLIDHRPEIVRLISDCIKNISGLVASSILPACDDDIDAIHMTPIQADYANVGRIPHKPHVTAIFVTDPSKHRDLPRYLISAGSIHRWEAYGNRVDVAVRVFSEILDACEELNRKKSDPSCKVHRVGLLLANLMPDIDVDNVGLLVDRLKRKYLRRQLGRALAEQ